MQLSHHRGDLKPTMALMLARAEHVMARKNWYHVLTNNCEHCMFTGRSLSPLLNIFFCLSRGDKLPPLFIHSSSAH